MHPLAFALPPTQDLRDLGIVGLCIGVCFALSVLFKRLVFGSFRRKAWVAVVFSSLGALVVLALWMIVLGVAGYGLYDVSTSIPKPSASKVPQTIQGQKLPYHFLLPADWKAQWNDKTFDFAAEHDGLHLGIVSAKSTGDVAAVAKMSQDRTKGATQSQASDTSKVVIDGHVWQRSTMKVRPRDSAMDYHYLHYTYSGEEGVFQVVGWRTQPLRAQDTDTLHEIAFSFRFPSSPDFWELPAPAEKLAEAKVLQGIRAPYTLIVPAGWTIRRQVNNDLDLRLERGGLRVGVVVESSTAASTEELLRFAQNRTRKMAALPEISPTSVVLIDGREWSHFSAELQTGKSVLIQDNYVYAGPEGAFQLFGLTPQENFPRDEPDLRTLAISFRFPPSTESVTQTVRGKQADYKLTLPPGWKAKYSGDAFDLLASRGNLNFAVATNEGTSGTTEGRMKTAQDQLRKACHDFEADKTIGITIDGREWLRFTARYRSEGVLIVTDHLLRVGPEGTFQMIYWAPAEQFARYTDDLYGIASSFHFPAPTATAMPLDRQTAKPSPPPETLRTAP